MNHALRALAVFWLAWPGLSAADDAAVPYLSGRVVDQAEIMTAPARERIGNLLQAHEQATGNQIAVLTIDGIGAESIEDFAVRVFETWKLGSREQDNGVLVVVAPREHRMRIEVGYGLEGTLTDVAADRIIRNLMTPRFREGNFDVGIEAGVTAVVQILEGRLPSSSTDAEWAAPASRASGFHVEGAPMALPERILVSLFVFGIIGLFTFIGIVTPGGMGWFMYLFLIPFWSMFPLAIFGSHAALIMVASYAVLYPFARIVVSRMPWYLKAKEDLKTKGVANIGGMVIRPGGSSSSGGFSSGGGFSGGGGRSGGGGASGSW